MSFVSKKAGTHVFQGTVQLACSLCGGLIERSGTARWRGWTGSFEVKDAIDGRVWVVWGRGAGGGGCDSQGRWLAVSIIAAADMSMRLGQMSK